VLAVEGHCSFDYSLFYYVDVCNDITSMKNERPLRILDRLQAKLKFFKRFPLEVPKIAYTDQVLNPHARFQIFVTQHAFFKSSEKGWMLLDDQVDTNLLRQSSHNHRG
jgi:hypothetical protein